MRAALLSLLLALPLFAQFDGYYRFEPVAPTDRSFVVLQVREVWRDGCLPRRERITINGSAITVRYEVPTGFGCTLALEPWNDDAPLGVLSAGVYTVTVEVQDYQEVKTLATLTLVVTQGGPRLSIAPRIASTAGGTQITIANVCTQATLIVDGVTVPSSVANCVLTATLPAHAAGPVNVRLITPGRTSDTVNGIHYVDPAATPEESLYERVLIPVLFRGPGAFGSQWETEAVMTNVSVSALGVLPNVSAALRPNTSLWTLFGDRPTGLLLFVPRGSDARFANHIRDVSRDATQWGTEVPVVRESDTKATIVLPNVPFDRRYRLQLRIYGIDGVRARIGVSSGTTHRDVELRGPCAAMPCNSNQPAYASADLGQLFPALAGKQTITVSQGRYQPLRIWAFVTVTNNETQHVTVISPQ